MRALYQVGAFLRRRIGSRDALQPRTELCFLCGEPTDPGRRRWSHARQRWVDEECIPAFLRNLGDVAVNEWLEVDGKSWSG